MNIRTSSEQTSTTLLSHDQDSTRGQRDHRRVRASGTALLALLTAGCAGVIPNASTTSAASPNNRPADVISADCTKGSYNIWGDDTTLDAGSVGTIITAKDDTSSKGTQESFSYLIKKVTSDSVGDPTSYDLQMTGWSSGGVQHPPISTADIHVALGERVMPGQYFDFYAGTPNSTHPQDTDPSNLSAPGFTVACHLPLTENSGN